jgi:hypothetical protein
LTRLLTRTAVALEVYATEQLEKALK